MLVAPRWGLVGPLLGLLVEEPRAVVALVAVEQEREFAVPAQQLVVWRVLFADRKKSSIIQQQPPNQFSSLSFSFSINYLGSRSHHFNIF